MIDFKALMNIAKSSQFTPFVVGPVGSGKTTNIREQCEAHGLTLADVNLSSMDAQELAIKVSTKDGKIEYGVPDFYNADVVLFDEIDRVTDQQVKTCLIKLLWDRELNGNKVRGIILTAGNQEHDAANTEMIDRATALGSRLVRVDFNTTHKERVAHYEKRFGNTRAVQYFEQNATLFKEHDKRLETFFVQFAEDPAVMSLNCLPKGLVNSFKTWCSHMSYTLEDVINGGRDFKDEITNIKIVNDMSNLMIDGSANFPQWMGWSQFINQQNAETAALFFDKLRKAVNNPEKGEQTLKNLDKYNKQGAFSGQARYLKGLLPA